MWHTEQGWRIQRVVVHIADSADPLSQSGCCWKRVFFQQRSAGSKHAGDELESNQTCAQLCCISEDQDIRLHCADKLLKSCSHASNKYKMYLMEKKAEKKTDMGQKRKALQDELMAAKKKKTELESVASWLLDTANKKAKEAEKKSGVAAMKALIMESMHPKKEQKKWRERTFQPKQEKSRTLKRNWRNGINSNWYSGIKERNSRTIYVWYNKSGKVLWADKERKLVLVWLQCVFASGTFSLLLSNTLFSVTFASLQVDSNIFQFYFITQSIQEERTVCMRWEIFGKLPWAMKGSLSSEVLYCHYPRFSFQFSLVHHEYIETWFQFVLIACCLTKKKKVETALYTSRLSGNSHISAFLQHTY